MDTTNRLRLALRLNAGFSTFSALTIFFASGQLGQIMGVDPRLLIAVGVALALFAGQLVYTSLRGDVRKLRTEALLHSLADFGWVAGSAAIIAAGLLTPTGNGLLIAVALPVLVLGISQFRSLPDKDVVSA